MPSNKRHHYVPRFYLKNFSGDGRSINLFNLDRNRIVRNASFKTQCYKDYYYGRNQVLEKLLADIEGESAQILAYIIENRQLPSTNEQRKKLSIYLMAQHGRIPNTTAVVSEMRDRFASAIRDIAKETGEAEVEDFSNLDAVLTSVALSIKAYTCLADLQGRLLLSAPGQEFITSDTPVASCNSFFSYRPFGDAASFGWRGYRLVFPISPTLALFLFD